MKIEWSVNMKRFRFLVLLTILSLTLIGCGKQNEELSLVTEFYRIQELIPEGFSNDYTFPSGSEGYNVTYFLDEEEIVDGMLTYTPQEKNSYLQVMIRIESETSTEEYYIVITMLGDVERYLTFTKNEVVDSALLEIRKSVPLYATSNITLPSFEDQDLDIQYTSDCTDIVRNRIEYTFPDDETKCYLDASVTFEDLTKSIRVSFKMTSLEDLPKIPSLYISTTDNQTIDSKDYYVDGVLDLEDSTDLTNNLSDAGISIRLRGNSTYWTPKKSYKIKFDVKTALLSDYKEKDWILLANYMDQTLVRDFVAFELASNLEMQFTPSYQFVDLYVNGEYQGNYLLTDQIEVTNDRIDIEENVTDIDTGFLIEYDVGLYREGLENTDDNYFVAYGIPFVLKSPDIDDNHYSNDQKEFISNYIEGVLYTLQMGNDYSNYIDEKSFIDWYIVNEVFKNVDSGYSSVYFYKDAGSLLQMGPVWDFDLSSGAYGHLGANLRGPEGWYTSREDKNKFFYYLMQYDSFKSALKERWNEVYDEILFEMPNNVLEASDSFTYSRHQNFERWDIIGVDNEWYISPELYVLDTYDEQVWFLYDFLSARIEWLDEEINKFE